jgi:hypothetical protein
MKVRTNISAGQAQGLGDTIASLATLTGLNQLAKTYEQVTGKPCGCKERQALLNQWLPYPNQPT